MTPHPDLLASVVRERRAELGLSMARVASLGGPSEPTLVRLESGASPPLRSPTLQKLDMVLQWPTGTARALYHDGVEPVAEETEKSSAITLPPGLATQLVKLAHMVDRVDSELRRDAPNLSTVRTIVADQRAALLPVLGQLGASMLNRPASYPHSDVARIADALELLSTNT